MNADNKQVNKVKLNIHEIEKIMKVLKQFPESTSVELIQDSSSGIGSTVIMRLQTEVNGIIGNFEVEVSGSENW